MTNIAQEAKRLIRRHEGALLVGEARACGGRREHISAE